MQYRQNQAGEPLSVLGFGCLRFLKKRGAIDLDAAQEQVLAAIARGVNYFDTAYIYSGSEAALGEILERTGCRDKVNIATKLPHYLLKKAEDMDRYFDEQLRRLRTDHVDYYLFHMLPDVVTWQWLQTLGVEAWLEEKRRRGQIRHVGFSYHGNTVEFQKLLEVYPWNFCQVQYNYLDEHTQAGRAGVERARAMGIPVIIMEPLRGGRLVNGLPKGAEHCFAQMQPRRSPAEWGLKWLWNQEAVTVVLSGMNALEMVEENCRVAEETPPGSLSQEELALFDRVKGAINEKIKVGCTGCSYCMPCPKGVDIPGTFRCYNARYTDGWFTGLREYFMCTTFRATRSNASLCVKCGRCEQHCPQGIQIRAELDNAAHALEGIGYRVAVLGAKLLKRM